MFTDFAGLVFFFSQSSLQVSAQWTPAKALDFTLKTANRQNWDLKGIKVLYIPETKQFGD